MKNTIIYIKNLTIQKLFLKKMNPIRLHLCQINNKLYLY
jgi:hypothetical protein